MCLVVLYVYISSEEFSTLPCKMSCEVFEHAHCGSDRNISSQASKDVAQTRKSSQSSFLRKLQHSNGRITLLDVNI